jgi:hypothetical protein
MGIIVSKKSEETNSSSDLNEIRRQPIQRTLSETSSHAVRPLLFFSIEYFVFLVS